MSIIPFPTTRRTLPGFTAAAATVTKQPVKPLDQLLGSEIRDRRSEMKEWPFPITLIGDPDHAAKQAQCIARLTRKAPGCCLNSDSEPPAIKPTPIYNLWCELAATLPPDTILFIQVGDFHETFVDHAAIAAPLLNVALTKRQDVPMCGIPVHAEDTYFKRLLEAGKTILLGTRGEDGNFHITRTLSPPTDVPPTEEPPIIQRQKEFIAMEDGYQPGAILYSSWGYDQTNIDFYRIEKRAGLMLTLAPLQSTVTETHYMSGHRIPTDTPKDYFTDHDVAWGNKDKENPKPLFKRKLKTGADGKPNGTVISHGWCRLWDGKPMTCSWYA